MAKLGINISKLADVDGFFPHYQYEHPLKFGVLLSRFMKDNPSKNQGRHLANLRHAVKTVNHQIMLNKLGIDIDDDNQRKNPQKFEEEFLRLAKDVPHLEVKDGKIQYRENAPAHLVNTLYEHLWQKANERVGSNSRTLS